MGFKRAPSSTLQYHLLMIYDICHSPARLGKLRPKTRIPHLPQIRTKGAWNVGLGCILNVSSQWFDVNSFPNLTFLASHILTLYVPIRSCETLFWIPETARERKCSSKWPIVAGFEHPASLVRDAVAIEDSDRGALLELSLQKGSMFIHFPLPPMLYRRIKRRKTKTLNNFNPATLNLG